MFGAGRAALQSRSPVLVPTLLFAASSAFIFWRNSQVAVLVDISYVVNIATRIAKGDVPYAQFPLAQAPLTFLAQAVLIKAFGPHFLVQILYASIVGGLATVLTYRIARRLVDGAVPEPTAIAATLTIPLVPLGIYAIITNPFYDPDTCFVVLAAIAAILAAIDRPTRSRWLVAGALIAVPVFVKQNFGGAFMVLALGALVADAWARPSARAGLRWGLIGFGIGLGAELFALQLVVGIDHFLAWAWTFAMAGRGVTLDRISAFWDPTLIWPGVLLLALVLATRALSLRLRAPTFIGVLLVALLARASSPSSFLNVNTLLTPVLLAASVLAIAKAVRDGARFDTVLPLVLSGTVAGALMSLGLNGSSFATFPLLVLAIAAVVRDLARFVREPAQIAAMTGVMLALLLAMSGTAYTLTNARLLFADVNAPGPVVRSEFPSLAGLSARGPYIGDLDTILFWMRDNVPADDAFVFLPGEDPVFFALDRRPRLPSVYFFDVANPYSPAEIASFADEVGLRWVFVKDRLQLVEEPPLNQRLIVALTDHATLVAQVGPYRVYRR
ncbi:MAG: glycosyltransferase family 39 protein [Chloroflexota bacterium]